MVIFFSLFFSIIVFYRYFKYFCPNRKTGNFLFCSIYSEKDKLLFLFSVVLYIGLIILFYKYGLFDSVFLRIDIILIFTWIIQLFLPSKIYDYGIKTPYYFVSWNEISSIDLINKNHVILYFEQRNISKKLTLHMKEGDELPINLK